MHGQAYLPSSIHLLSLSIELRQLDLGRSRRVRNGDIKLKVKFVLQQVMDVPAFSGPPCAVGVGGGDAEPVVVIGLVHGGVGDQRLVLLLETLRPGGAVAWAGFGGEEGDLG